MRKNLFILCFALSCYVINNKVNAQAQQVPIDTAQHYADEKPASFPGGLDGWRKYLEANLHYPNKAVRKKIQGLVKVEMTVDASGKVKDVKAQNDPGGGLAAEAERVVSAGPNWIPAFQNGKNVTYRFVQSITFALN